MTVLLLIIAILFVIFIGSLVDICVETKNKEQCISTRILTDKVSKITTEKFYENKRIRKITFQDDY